MAQDILDATFKPLGTSRGQVQQVKEAQEERTVRWIELGAMEGCPSGSDRDSQTLRRLTDPNSARMAQDILDKQPRLTNVAQDNEESGFERILRWKNESSRTV